MAQTWLCAIAVLIAIAVQSQAQTNAANEHSNKAPNPSGRKLFFL